MRFIEALHFLRNELTKEYGYTKPIVSISIQDKVFDRLVLEIFIDHGTIYFPEDFIIEGIRIIRD